MRMEAADRRTAFGLRLLRLARLWRQAVDAEIQKDTFPDSGWRALIGLHRSGEGLRQKDLAAAMAIEGPSLVRLLDNLGAAGLVRREMDAGDRRARRLVLTPEGRAAAARIEARLSAAEAALLDGLPDSELDACSAVLSRLEQRLHARKIGTP
ncbi:MarR family winged helix-turn-helix transcriptional regulator [Teichococcus oryzae]|uniref:MarR family transcriptional regulator n=1 Tax=Teichococcus oryzae TaxID=1608942 RepID=A0A5B2TF76_9PROT|nr:MarR family transcriptional regulator [Pseudoroseomonas oryzae]KAA2212665.1 MarR family transcriptional regulator [Pseudoroseomonas oryzae]